MINNQKNQYRIINSELIHIQYKQSYVKTEIEKRGKTKINTRAAS